MLLKSLLRMAAEDPNRPAVADEQHTLTYGELAAAAGAVAGHLTNITAANTVGLMLPTSTAFPVAFYGSLLADKIPVPLNYLLQSPEISRIIQDAAIDTVLTTQVFLPQLNGLPLNVVALESLPPPDSAPAVEPPEHGPDDTAVILYTSGTSGQPKGVCLTHRNLQTNCEACIRHARMNPEHIFLAVLPMFHSFGLMAMMLVPVTLGAQVICLPRFQPQKIVECVSSRRVSVLMAIPSMYGTLLHVKNAAAEDLSSLVYAISGGEALPPNIADGMEQRFGVRIMEGYGLTETSPVVSMNMPWQYKAGSVGTALPDVQLRAVDEHGRDVPTNEPGEVLVRGPNVMAGYHHRPDETAMAIDRQGWFHTGDYGSLSGDGFLSIRGRKKEIIIVAGENVFPREVENVLEAHAAVREAAVLGVPDASHGEVVTAFVAPDLDPQITESDLRDFCRQRLAGYKVPRRIVRMHELPHGPTGKILKRQLRDRL